MDPTKPAPIITLLEITHSVVRISSGDHTRVEDMRHREGKDHHEEGDPEEEDGRMVDGPHRSSMGQEEGSRDGRDRHSGPEEGGNHQGVLCVEAIDT